MIPKGAVRGIVAAPFAFKSVIPLAVAMPGRVHTRTGYHSNSPRVVPEMGTPDSCSCSVQLTNALIRLIGSELRLRTVRLVGAPEGTGGTTGRGGRRRRTVANVARRVAAFVPVAPTAPHGTCAWRTSPQQRRGSASSRARDLLLFQPRYILRSSAYALATSCQARSKACCCPRACPVRNSRAFGVSMEPTRAL